MYVAYYRTFTCQNKINKILYPLSATLFHHLMCLTLVKRVLVQRI